MKRGFGILLTMAIPVAAMAQAPFTIVRPLEGAKVRETVKVWMPKNGIPENGYVGVFINGKFVEAVVPRQGQVNAEYLLDTKARNIVDGPVKLELVLYQDLGGNTRVLDRSSVNMTVSNRSSIEVPADGLKLRYKFVPGREYTYSCERRTAANIISEAQAKLGGRAAELPIDSEKFRMLYAIDNAYSNGDGLVRMQALPDKGKDYTFLTIAGENEAKKWLAYQMHPLYMRLNSTGFQVFGAAPVYVPLEGTSGETYRYDLYANFPLPSLPVKPVKLGSFWQARFQLPALDMDKLREANSLVQNQIARGDLVSFEWEMGHPCAKIRHSIAVGQGQSIGKDSLGRTAQKMDEVMYFALDIGMPIKIVLDFTTDQKMVAAAPSGGGGGGNTGNRGATGDGERGGPGRGRGPAQLPGGEGGAGPIDPTIMGQRGPVSGGAEGGDGDGVRGQGTRGGPAGGRSGSGGGPGVTQYLRIRQQLIFVMEK